MRSGEIRRYCENVILAVPPRFTASLYQARSTRLAATACSTRLVVPGLHYPARPTQSVPRQDSSCARNDGPQFLLEIQMAIKIVHRDAAVRYRGVNNTRLANGDCDVRDDVFGFVEENQVAGTPG